MPDDSMEYEELLAVAQHLWADNQNLYAMSAKLDDEANMHKRRCDLYIIRRNALATKVGELDEENARLRELIGDMGKMLTLASWTSVENDEQASQCIYRAEALGVEVEL